MPRKKLETPASVTPSESATDNLKPAPARRRTKAAPMVEAAEVATPSAPVEKPKPSRSRKTVAPASVSEPVVQAPAVEESVPATPRSRSRRSSAKPVAIPEPVAPVAAEPVTPEPVAPKGRTPRRSPRKAEVAATPVTLDDAQVALNTLLAEFDVLPIEWRAATKPVKTDRPNKVPRVESSVEAESGEGTRDGRSRRRRRRGKGRGGESESAEPTLAPEATVESAVEIHDGESVQFRGRRKATDKPVEKRAEKAKAVVKPEPVVPEIPVRPEIVIPQDAPQVVLREGIPTLVRKGRVYPPISFFGGSSDEQRARNVLDEMRMAGEAGIHLHSHLIEFDVNPQSVAANVSMAGYLLKKTLEVDPEAQVLFRVVFVAQKGWTEKFPLAKYTNAQGQLAEPSVCDDEFWEVAQRCLEDFVRQLRMLPQAESVLGLHLDRGEWFHADGEGYDTSRAAKAKFREWAKGRYGGDVVALRAAWFDGSADFERLEIPAYEAQETDKFVRANRKERKWVDYHLFLSDVAVSRINELAYATKESSQGYFLVGVSYGYTFEFSHPASGHLSLGKLLRSPDVDFIAGPPSYRNREPGGTASFPVPIDSLALNGKLYLSEEDFKTSLGTGFDPDDFNPKISTPQALESVHWRGVGAALAHLSGVSWMDSWGNGWLKTSSVWDRAKEVQQALVWRMGCPQADPDVAVFIDERSLAYLVDQKGFALLVQNVRESVMRAGMSAGFYLLSDLQHRETFPESRLYVFLNAWDVRPQLRAAIKTRLQRGNKVLFWLYTAGLFDSGRESLERAREVTGIALKPQPFHSRTGTTIVNRRHPLCDAFEDKANVGGTRLEPSYFAIPEDGVVLGEYSQNGLPSFVLREFKTDPDPSLHWRSVFLGEPIVTPSLLRALGQMAGAHVWNFTEDVVHVREPFLTVHCTGAGPRTITMPSKCSAYNVITREWVAIESTSLKFNATDGSTHVFLVGVKDELEHILQTDPDAMLKMENLPPRVINMVGNDAGTFDVPIMRLDQWMDTTDSEGLTDDLLFKPRLLEEIDEEEPERVGRRRRRKVGRGGRGGSSDESSSRRRDGEAVSIDDSMSMTVVFRKRDA